MLSLMTREQMNENVKREFLATHPRRIEGRLRELKEAIDDNEDESFIEYLRSLVADAEARYKAYTA